MKASAFRYYLMFLNPDFATCLLPEYSLSGQKGKRRLGELLQRRLYSLYNGELSWKSSRVGLPAAKKRVFMEHPR